MLQSVEESEIYLYLSPKTLSSHEYIFYTYLIYVPPIVINVLMVVFVLSNKLIRIERNLFVLNLSINYLLQEAITFAHVLFTYEDIAYREELGLLFYYPTTIALTTCRAIFYVLFHASCSRVVLKKRKSLVFYALWSITVAYAIALIGFLSRLSHDGHLLSLKLPQYVQLAAIGAATIVYVSQTYAFATKVRANRLTVDSKVRFFVVSVYVLFSAMRLILIATTSSPSVSMADDDSLLKYYLLDSLEVVVFLVVITCFDRTFRRVLSKSARCPKPRNKAAAVDDGDAYDDDDDDGNSNCVELRA